MGNECILTTDGSRLPISGCGQTVVHSSTDRSLVIQDLLLVQNSSHNLLSVNKFCCDNNVCFVFDSQRVQVWDPATRNVLLEGRACDGLYELPLQQLANGRALMCENSLSFLCHCRLGHLNSSYLSVLVNDGLIKSSTKLNKCCDACFAGKSHALPHPSRCTLYDPFELVFSDIWGPSPVISHEGFSYYVNFVDACSNFNWVYPMARKSDLYKVFEEFRALAERQCGR